MCLRHLLSLVVLVTLSVPCCQSSSTPVNSHILLQDVKRKIDLTSQLVSVSASFNIRNKGKDEVDEFLVVLTSQEAEHLAYFEAGQPKSKGGLGLLYAPTKVNDAPDGFEFFAVRLTTPIPYNETSKINVHYVFQRYLTPLPSEIAQDEAQRVIFHDNHFFLTPYTVSRQNTKVTLPGTSVESFTEEAPTAKEGDQIVYGVYKGVAPYTVSPMTIHFENNSPFQYATKIVREIEVSHWGNVYFEEHIHLEHAGAKHKGPFSRLDYQRMPHSHAVATFNDLFAQFPPGADSIYYKDEIGNISTSRVRMHSSGVDFEFSPRYPMLGGWKVFFFFGYSLPLPTVVFKVKSGDYMLNTSFTTTVHNLPCDDYEVRVVLPEGSFNVKALVPFEVEESRDVKYSYLDTAGRPVVVLRKSKVVDEHDMEFQITYRFSSLSMLREPFLIVGALLLFFLTCMAYMRMDLTISKDTQYFERESQEQVADALAKICSLFASRAAALDRLDRSLEDLGKTGQSGIEACLAEKAGITRTLDDLASKLKDAILEIERMGPAGRGAVAEVRQLQAKESEKKTLAMQLFGQKIDCVRRELPISSIEQKLKGPEDKYAVTKAKVQEMLADLKEYAN